MSIVRFLDVLQDTAGNVIPDAEVSVYETGTSTPVTLYADAEGNTPLAGNLVTTNARGEFSFYAVNGTYDLAIEAAGYTSYTKVAVGASVIEGNWAEAGVNDTITALTGLNQVIVTDEGAPTGDMDSLVDVQGLSSHWHYNLRRRDLGHDTRMGSDGVGIVTEHPIRTAPFGRTITVADDVVAELGLAHQGALLRCGVTEAPSHLLDFVSNVTDNGITTMFIVQAVDYDVTLSVSAGGDTLDGTTDDMVIVAGQAAMLTCDADNEWRSYRVGGNAQLKTIPHADVGITVGVPGRDLYYVPDYGGGSYWAPNAGGTLLRLGANNGTQAVETTVAAFRGLTPLDAALYYVTDWPASRGSYWVNRDGVLDPMGGRERVAICGEVALVANTSEQAGLIGLIPAGVLKPGYVLSVFAGPGKDGVVDTMNLRVRIGTDPGGLSPNTEVIQGVSIVTNRSDGQWFKLYVVSNTSVRRIGGQGPNDCLSSTTGAAAAPVTIPDLSANDLYVSVTQQISTAGGETPTLYGAVIEIEG